MSQQERIAGALIVLLIWLTWMFRYDLQVEASGGEGSASSGYVLDRWTGTVHFVAPFARRELREAKPAQ